MRGILICGLLAGVLMLLGACDELFPPPERAAPEPSEPKPPEVPTEADGTLIGTWSWEGTVPGGTRFVETLTFTASRFIHHQAEYDRSGAGTFSGAISGTYRVESATRVVRIWQDYDDGNRRTAELAKSYELRGGSLFVNPWGEIRETSAIREYRRVAMPLPELVGTWHVAVDFSNQDLTVRLFANGDIAMRQRSFDPDRIDYFLLGT